MRFFFNKNFFWETIFISTIFTGVYIRIIKFFNEMYYIVPDDCHSILSLPTISIYDCFTSFEQGANFLQLYKLLLKTIYNTFSYDFFAFRTPGLFISCLFLVLVYKFSKKVFNNKFIIFTVLSVVAFNYNLIEFTLRLKPYIFDAFFTLFIIYFAMKIDEQDKKNITVKETCFYSLFSVFNTFMSIACVGIFQCCWGLLFIKNILIKNFSNVKKLVVIEFFSVIALICQYFIYIHKMLADKDLHLMWFNYGWFHTKPDSLDALNSLFNTVLFDFAWQDYNYARYDNKVLIAVLLLFLAGTAVCLTNSIKKKKIGDLFIIAPVYSFVLLSFLEIYPLANRLIIFLIVPIIIIMFKAFDFSNKKYVKIISSVCTLIVLSAFFYNVHKKNSISLIYGDNRNYSKETYEFIKELENSNPENTFILSSEFLCTGCIKNNDIYYYNPYYFDITQKNVDLYIVDRRGEFLGEHVPLKKLFGNKQKIYYNYFKDESTDIIKNEFISSGYEEGPYICNSIICYTVFTKKE